MENFDWTHLPNLEIRTGVLGIAEVRDGPSDDAFVVRVKPGTYRPCLGQMKDEEEGLAVVRLIHERALGGWGDRWTVVAMERGGVAGWISTNLASVCAFDHEVYEDVRTDPTSDFEVWKREFYDKMDPIYGFRSMGEDSRLNIFHARGIENGGHYPISEIFHNGSPVGIEIAFAPRIVDLVDQTIATKMEWLVQPAGESQAV